MRADQEAVIDLMRGSCVLSFNEGVEAAATLLRLKANELRWAKGRAAEMLASLFEEQATEIRALRRSDKKENQE